jgi:hypothetical protein
VLPADCAVVIVLVATAPVLPADRAVAAVTLVGAAVVSLWNF